MNIRQVLRYQLYVGAEPFNKRNPLLWICKIPFGHRLIDLISLSAQTENFILQRGSFAFAARSIFCQNRKRTILLLQ